MVLSSIQYGRSMKFCGRSAQKDKNNPHFATQQLSTSSCEKGTALVAFYW